MTETIKKPETEAVASTDLFADLRRLKNGEPIKEGDLFLWQDQLFPATDVGNGIMSDNHFPHFRTANPNPDPMNKTMKHIGAIPNEITEAALKIEQWAAENGHKDWRFMGICSRDILERLERKTASSDLSPKETGKPAPDSPHWECFCDEAYYDYWAVRPTGESGWGHCFHLIRKEEAQGLCDLLNSLTKKK